MLCVIDLQGGPKKVSLHINQAYFFGPPCTLAWSTLSIDYQWQYIMEPCCSTRCKKVVLLDSCTSELWMTWKLCISLFLPPTLSVCLSLSLWRRQPLSPCRSIQSALLCRHQAEIERAFWTSFASVYRFCISILSEDPECRPEELENGLDWCWHDKGGQRKTGAVDETSWNIRMCSLSSCRCCRVMSLTGQRSAHVQVPRCNACLTPGDIHTDNATGLSCSYKCNKILLSWQQITYT